MGQCACRMHAAHLHMQRDWKVLEGRYLCCHFFWVFGVYLRWSLPAPDLALLRPGIHAQRPGSVCQRAGAQGGQCTAPALLRRLLALPARLRCLPLLQARECLAIMSMMTSSACGFPLEIWSQTTR